jgi:hypothetical protein
LLPIAVGLDKTYTVSLLSLRVEAYVGFLADRYRHSASPRKALEVTAILAIGVYFVQPEPRSG